MKAYLLIAFLLLVASGLMAQGKKLYLGWTIDRVGFGIWRPMSSLNKLQHAINF